MKSVTRGKLVLAVDERIITLSGEMMPPGNPVDFYADLASIRAWDDGTPVAEPDRVQIIDQLPKVAAEHGWTITLD